MLHLPASTATDTLSKLAPSAQLEPPESNSPTLESLPGGVSSEPIGLAESFRHSGWAHNRRLVYAALKRTMQTVPRITAFASCGAFAYVYQSVKPPYEYRLGGSSCRDRFCVPCAAERSRNLAANVLDALDLEPARFLTLTLKTNDGPLATQIDRLYSCFSVLRKRHLWRSRVTGGCAFTEVKWSRKTDAWNVHVHCIIHGAFLPKWELSKAWHEITGDSMIVDLRVIRDRGHITRYVTKYASKPFDNTFVNRQPLFDEVIRAMHGRRLCFTFGTWRGIRLTELPVPGDWVNLGSFHDVVCRARDGEPGALQAITYIAGDRTQALIDAAPTARAPPLEPVVHHHQHLLPWDTVNNQF